MTKREFAYLLFGYLLAHSVYYSLTPEEPLVPTEIRMQLIEVEPIPLYNSLQTETAEI